MCFLVILPYNRGMEKINLLAADLGLSGCDPSKPDLNLGDCYRLSGSQKVSDVYDTPATMANLIVRNLFVISGVVMLVMIIYAGFQYISDTEKGADKAKSIATAVGIGFIMMFAAYWIVQIIKVVTGADILL